MMDIHPNIEPNIEQSAMNESIAIQVPKVKEDVTVVYALNDIIIPAIAILGMIGNGLNIVVLSWRHQRRDVDIMEKGALLGLIALAASDMAFCMVIFPTAFLPTRTWFTTYGVHLNYQVYSLYFKNLFIKTSTWMTLMVGFARYVGICHPLRARLCIGLRGIRMAILFTFAFWALAEAPLLWTYSIQNITVSNVTYHYLDLGEFVTNVAMEKTFTYVWAILGYFMPVTILIFCNSCLIRALRQSKRLRREVALQNDVIYRDSSTRITLTLIMLILMFILLISPSEILHFVIDAMPFHSMESFKLSMACTNVLQVVNFAFSFILYCMVNAAFRRTITDWVGAFNRNGHGEQVDSQNDEQYPINQNSKRSISDISSGISSRHSTTRLYYCAVKKHSLGSLTVVKMTTSNPTNRTFQRWDETCDV